MDKLPTMTIPEALNYLRNHRNEVYCPMVREACLTVEGALLQNIDKPWHPCTYVDDCLFIPDGPWESGKWYEWLDKYNNREIARMKNDIGRDHFFPPTKVISEKNVIAFREIEVL